MLMTRDANAIDTVAIEAFQPRGGATKGSPKSFASETQCSLIYKICRLISMLMCRSGYFKAPLTIYYESAYLRG